MLKSVAWQYNQNTNMSGAVTYVWGYKPFQNILTKKSKPPQPLAKVYDMESIE